MTENRFEDNQEKRLISVRVIKEQGLRSNQELAQDIDISECLDEQGGLNLRKLLLLLKLNFNFALQNKEISYYSPIGDLWINCGIDPVSEDMRVRGQVWQKGIFTVKGKQLGVSVVHRLMSMENFNTGEQKDRTGADQMAERSKCRRTKQRRIGHIIDKVLEWRKYYSGVINEKNQHKKYSLQDAARQVKISKKSLDDYLFQIRFGHRYGFNFNEHYNDKVGVLRDFVRQRKKCDKVEIKEHKGQKGFQKDLE